MQNTFKKLLNNLYWIKLENFVKTVLENNL